MCTLMFYNELADKGELVIGLNRDEFVERPSSDFAFVTGGHDGATWVGGRDEVSGGTWFAIGEHLIAAVTNDRTGGLSKPGKRSRGELVLSMSQLRSLDDVESQLAQFEAHEFGPFHLVVFGDSSALHITNVKSTFHTQEVSSGFNVLGNMGLNHDSDIVVSTVLEYCAQLPDQRPEAMVESFKELLARHGQGFPCVHLGPFGTVSTAVYSRVQDQEVLFTANGTPCRTPWRDSSSLLHALRA